MYSKPQATPKANPDPLILIVFTGHISFICRGRSVVMPAEHQQMTPEHQHDEDEQRDVVVDSEQREQEHCE
ncbi:MAG TPA: hypothetical protein DF699_16355 [Phycisphaerales bacterium]|nr:hypothetical protein [Phycisphaerales bacterium]